MKSKFRMFLSFNKIVILLKNHTAMMKTKFSVVLLLILYMSLQLHSQTFSDIRAGLTGVAESSSGWMDTDRDGDPDIIVAGEFYSNQQPVIATKHYNNNRNDLFTAVSRGIPDFYRGDFAIGDLDLDGINDLAVVGETRNGGRIGTVLRGLENGGFAATNVRFTAVRDGSIDLGDMDGDGDLDVLLNGESTIGPVSLVYRNNRNWNFMPLDVQLTATRRGMARWSDYNLDGLPDVLISGISTQGQPITELFQNTGKGFVKNKSSFVGLKNSSMAFGDVDNDGDDDVILLGETVNGSKLSQLYKNNRTGFTAVKTSFVTVTDGFADWGDMDLDGDLDLLLSGMSDQGPVSRIYTNNRNYNFKDIGAGIIPLYKSSGEWGDYDLDGDLDVLIAGLTTNQEFIARVYNNGIISNKKPVAKTEVSNWETISAVPSRQEPIYYYVYSSSYGDLFYSGKNTYHVFMSPVKKFPKDYVLEEKFQSLLIEKFPNWAKADQGNIVQNGFVTKQEAEKSRKQMIHDYETKGFKLIEINW